MVEQHIGELLGAWPLRFVRTHGRLRPVVERVLREFLFPPHWRRADVRGWNGVPIGIGGRW